LYSYIKTSSQAEEILSAAVYEALMDRTINTTLDTFLSVDRGLLSASLLGDISEFCKSEKLGLAVVDVIVESVHPPVGVADVYQEVVNASLNKNTTITNARADADVTLLNAEQRKQIAIDNAKTEQHRRVSEAKNEMAVYFAAIEAYKVKPESFRLTKLLDTYETIIKGNKAYVFSPGTENDMFRFIIGTNRNLLSPVMDKD